MLEDDLPGIPDQTFIHPVLDRARYVDSTLRIWKMSDLFDTRSGLRRRLSRVPVHVYARPLARVVWNRFNRSMRRRLVPAA